MNVPTQLMPVNLSSDLNTETEYYNPASTGVEDMRGLLNRLETMQMDNTPLNTVVNRSFDDILINIAKSDYQQMWEYCIFTAIYDLTISNEIRIGILNLSRMLFPLNSDVKPEQVIAAWIFMKPLVDELIQKTRPLISYKDTFVRLTTMKNYISTYISNNTKTDKHWSAWQENYYIIYTKDKVNYFRDLISNWDSILIEGMPYLKHKNSLDCFKHVQPKQWVKGDILHDIYSHKSIRMRTQICTSDLADQVGEVQPCRCAGCRCRGCECCNSCGKDGRCRCHCVQDTYK